MIFLGAGASAPLGIPTMEGFVRVFEEKIKGDVKLVSLYENIRSSIENSAEFIDTTITFDLESLMPVLEDVSGLQEKRTVSSPTFAFLLFQFNRGKLKSGSVKEARHKFGANARKMLKELRYTIFDVCMKPILIGERNRSHAPLARYYGALFTLLGHGNPVSSPSEWVFTANWDLCLKTWMDYIPWPYEDGTVQDPQKNPVFSPSAGWPGSSNTFHVVPLHGSLNLITVKKLRARGDYIDIYKVTSPHVYFEGKPDEIEKILMIYPLEAVGYERSVQAPYLDMLNLLKTRLRKENRIFVIGFSFRDPTISSIFDEVLRERIREEESAREEYKLFLIDSNPTEVKNNLERQGFVNIQRDCIPIDVKFPNADSAEFAEEFSQVLTEIGRNLLHARAIDHDGLKRILEKINRDYRLQISVKSLLKSD